MQMGGKMEKNGIFCVFEFALARMNAQLETGLYLTCYKIIHSSGQLCVPLKTL